MDSAVGLNIKSLDQRALAARLTIYAFIVMQVIGFAVQGLLIAGIGGQKLAERAPLVDAVGIGIFIVSAVAVLFWIHRAYENLYAISGGPFEFTPVSAMGWFFVPLGNLIMPFNAMRELWRESQGGPERNATSSPLLICWWICFVVGALMANVGASVLDRDNPDTALTGLILLDGGLTLRLVSAVLLHEIIRAIGQFQRQWITVGDVFD